MTNSFKKNLSERLMEDIKTELERIGYGSLEIYVQNNKVTQMTVRNIKKKHKEGEKQFDADFIDGIVAWGKQAEFAGNYLAKGRMVVIHGELKPDRWKDKEDKNHYRLTILANSIQSLDSKKKAS